MWLLLLLSWKWFPGSTCICIERQGQYSAHGQPCDIISHIRTIPTTTPPSSSWPSPISPSLRPLFTICAELSPVPVELSRGELLDNSRALYHFIQTSILHLRYCIVSFLYKPVFCTWTRLISVSFYTKLYFVLDAYILQFLYHSIQTCILYLRYSNFCSILYTLVFHNWENTTSVSFYTNLYFVLEVLHFIIFIHTSNLYLRYPNYWIILKIPVSYTWDTLTSL